MPWRKQEQNLGLGLTRKTVKPSSENASENATEPVVGARKEEDLHGPGQGARSGETELKPREQLKRSK